MRRLACIDLGTRMAFIASALMLAALAIPIQQTGIEADGPNGLLKGTLTTAGAADAPIVLIIPGSGPTDRDGNSPLGIKAAPYQLLAEKLAEHGISSVRIDKRGLFASAAALPDANNVTIDDYARDTQSWIAAIRHRTGAHCVWVLGHSEGGLVALVAAKATADICGLVLVAAVGRPVGEVLMEQLRANPANAPLLDAAAAAIDRLASGQRVDVATMPPPLAPLFGPAIQGFLISEVRLDPAHLVASTSKPILILQGERDLQVAVSDARRLKAANPHAELVLLPTTNHVLKNVDSDDRSANIATYADPHLPLAPGVVEPIVRFVGQPRND